MSKVPKKVWKALEDRAKYADKLSEAGAVVDDFIHKNCLEDKIEDFDWLTGVEIYANPYASAGRVAEVFRDFEGGD